MRRGVWLHLAQLYFLDRKQKASKCDLRPSFIPERLLLQSAYIMSPHGCTIPPLGKWSRCELEPLFLSSQAQREN
jgi:hypothetical protein